RRTVATCPVGHGAEAGQDRSALERGALGPGRDERLDDQEHAQHARRHEIEPAPPRARRRRRPLESALRVTHRAITATVPRPRLKRASRLAACPLKTRKNPDRTI